MLDNKRTKHSTPSAGVASGLSSSSKVSGEDKKGRGEGDGQIPHSKKSTHKTGAGTFKVC